MQKSMSVYTGVWDNRQLMNTPRCAPNCDVNNNGPGLVLIGGRGNVGKKPDHWGGMLEGFCDHGRVAPVSPMCCVYSLFHCV